MPDVATGARLALELECLLMDTRDDASLIARIRAGLSTARDADRVEAAMIRLRMCEEALAHIAAQCHCGHAFGAMRLPDRKQDHKEHKDV